MNLPDHCPIVPQLLCQTTSRAEEGQCLKLLEGAVPVESKVIMQEKGNEAEEDAKKTSNQGPVQQQGQQSRRLGGGAPGGAPGDAPGGTSGGASGGAPGGPDLDALCRNGEVNQVSGETVRV